MYFFGYTEYTRWNMIQINNGEIEQSSLSGSPNIFRFDMKLFSFIFFFFFFYWLFGFVFSLANSLFLVTVNKKIETIVCELLYDFIFHYTPYSLNCYQSL